MNSLLAVTRAAMTPAARTKLALDGELNDAMGLYRKGQLAEAESAFLRALELTRHDDEYASVLRKLAVVYEKMGRADDAQEAWEYANIPVIRPPLVTGIDPDAPRRADEGDDHHQQQQQQQQQQLLQLQAAEMGPGLTAAEMVAQQQEENARLVLSEADRMNQNRRFARSVVEMIRVDDQALVSPRFADTFSDTLTEPPREGLNGDADGRPNSNSAAATRAVAASGTRGGSGGNGSSGASGAVQRGRPRHRKAKKRGKTLDELRKMMREPELEGVAAYKMGKVYMRMKQAQKALRMLKRGLKAEKRRLAEIHVDHGQRILEEKKIRSRTKRAQLEQAEREIERYKELVSSERLTSDIHRALFDLMLNAAADLIATDDHGEETGAAGAGDNDRAALVAAARNAETNAADDATDATLASPLVSLDPSDPSALVTAGSRPSSTSGERAGDILLPQSRSFLLPNVAASSAAATKMEAECAFHGRTWLRTLSDRTAAPAHAADRFTHPLRSRPAHLRYVGRRTAGAWVGPLATLRTEVLEELAESGPGSIDQGLLQDLGAMHMRQGHFARAQEVMERRVASEKERASMARGVGLGVGPMGLGIGAARWETQATGRVAGMQADGTLAWHTGHGPGLARTVTVPALIQPGLAQAAGRAGHGGRAGQAAQGTGEWRRIARAGYGGTLGAPDIRRGDKLPEVRSAYSTDMQWVWRLFSSCASVGRNCRCRCWCWYWCLLVLCTTPLEPAPLIHCIFPCPSLSPPVRSLSSSSSFAPRTFRQWFPHFPAEMCTPSSGVRSAHARSRCTGPPLCRRKRASQGSGTFGVLEWAPARCCSLKLLL